ncbi:Grx4 family monothiol glutaredoxin [Ostreibacterium oceani]|uniref:Glutaredoxin n=1 Tax=Ostreibacterium oceani TaxID=2654998 RepID=A0A6N7EZG0_9GAMM|nr:Grx4 family monothiol glutaredoxin [Ostreibacterium oceani]MPV86567.1 Grx4 family monothiol glutaredoxin [Ostreibacterium oceani]
MEIKQKIESQLNEYPAILYMKGTPQFPQCGFSSRVVTILKRIGEPFAYVNVLAEPAVREHLPKISDWPTFPQLFINGELVGGCDIIEEMDQQGELAPLFEGLIWPEEDNA